MVVYTYPGADTGFEIRRCSMISMVLVGVCEACLLNLEP